MNELINSLLYKLNLLDGVTDQSMKLGFKKIKLIPTELLELLVGSKALKVILHYLFQLFVLYRWYTLNIKLNILNYR